MAQRRKDKRGFRNFIMLVVVTVMLGAALQFTGNLVNPFEFSYLLLNTPPIEADSGFQMIQLDDANTDTVQFTMPDNLAEDGEMPQQSYSIADYLAFSWADLGNVFYNLWVILVLTIAVIVVARPIGWLVKRFKQVTNRQTKTYLTQ